MEVNRERVRDMKAAVQRRVRSSSPSPEYSFDARCKEYALYRKGREEKAGGVWIACPFHSEEAPSLSFNQEKGIWHCFGCGVGGNYLDFLYLLNSEVKREGMSREVFFDNFLKENSDLQRELGFNTVWKKEVHTIEDFEPLERVPFKRRKLAGTFIELQEKLMKTNPSMEKIKLFIVMMQSGLPLDMVERDVFGKVSGKIYSIEELEEIE